MPATNYTPIQFYRSTTSGNVPSAANLSPGELALNIADNDMTMYFENASGVVKRFFNNPAELKYPTADGTSSQGIKTDGSKTLSFGDLASAAITNNTRQAVTSSATTTIDLASGQVIDLTMAASITSLSFTNVPASGTPVLVQIVVKNASDGTAYTIAWPSSVYWSGQYTGTTITNVQTAPTLATGANGVTTIALLTTDGGTKWRGWVEGTIPGGSLNSLYAWGSNDSGQLGQNSLDTRSSPVQVGSLTDWSSVSTNRYNGRTSVVAVKMDGTLWAWGNGYYGQLGISIAYGGTAGFRSSPVQVGSGTSWATVSSGGVFNCAIKTDGTLWTWGNGGFGRLGQGTTASCSSPIQVGSLTTWSKICATPRSVSAIKTDGTLWSWGRNNNGQLGLNSAVNQSSPVQVGALSTWSTLSINGPGQIMAAIKTDGTLWMWGAGTQGELGQGNTNSQSSPVQVGALTDWASVAAGNGVVLAVKTNGTLWGWGENTYGGIGDSSVVKKSSPVQVGALTTWSRALSCGTNQASIAIKTDGTLWSWGGNYNGTLGTNSYFSFERSSPVQVGAATDWSFISGATANVLALRTTTTVNPG